MYSTTEPTPASSHALFCSDDELLMRLRFRSAAVAACKELWSRHRSHAHAYAQALGATNSHEVVVSAFEQALRSPYHRSHLDHGFRSHLLTCLTHVLCARDQRASSTEPRRTTTIQAFEQLSRFHRSLLWYQEIETLQPAWAGRLLGLPTEEVSAATEDARSEFRTQWLWAQLTILELGPACLGLLRWMALHRSPAPSDCDHLANCARCAIITAEAQQLTRHLHHAVLTGILGVPGALAYEAALQQIEFETPEPLPAELLDRLSTLGQLDDRT